VTTTTSDRPEAQPRAASAVRVAALDGIRGLTIILVVVGHAGDLLWPRAPLDAIPVLRGFFGGGAVGVFFIVGGYLVTRGLLRDNERGVLDPVRFYLRRLVRLGVVVVPLVVAVGLVHLIDVTDPASGRQTLTSLTNVLTYTVNIQATTDILSTRSDLGHMWYLSVQQQVYLVLPLLVIAIRRRRRLALLCVELSVVAVVYRMAVLGSDGWIPATVSTLARADAVLLGALLALAGPRLRRIEPHGSRVILVSLLALAGLMAVLPELPAFSYLSWWGVAFTVVAGALVAAAATLTTGDGAARLVTAPPLAWLGRASLGIFVWHLPVFFFVARHTSGWEWFPRTLTAAALLGGLVWATHTWLEEPTRTWLRTHLQPRAVESTPEAVTR
jgi:peptidoglycan/LPS O-acetylase OafA/YrhL